MLSRLARRPWVVVAIVVALLSAFAAPLARLESDPSVDAFLARSDLAVQARDEVADRFGAGRMLVVQLRREAPLDEAALRLLAALADALGRLPGVNRVTHALEGLPARLDLLVRMEQGAPLSRAIRFSDADRGRYAYLLLVDRPAGTDSAALVERVEALLARLVPEGFLAALAGQDILDRQLQRSQDEVGRRLIPILFGVMALFLALLYRNLPTVVAVLVTVLAAEVAALEVLASFGQPLNLLTVLLPVLQLSLTTALALHLVTHVRLARDAGQAPAEALEHALRTQWTPCAWTAVTTAIGFGSLGASAIVPLRVLGLSMAVSILAALLLGFTLLPALLALMRARPRSGLRLGAFLGRIAPGRIARRRSWGTVCAACLLLAAVCLQGIPVETNGLHYFPPDHPLRRDTERVQQEVCGTSTLDVVLTAREGVSPVQLLDVAQHRLQDVPGVRGVLSLASLTEQALFRRSLVLPAGVVSGQRSFADDTVRELALRAALTEPYRQGQHLRFTLLLDTVGTEAYGPLRTALDACLDHLRGDERVARALVAGDFPIIMRVQDELMATLGWSLGITFLSILVVVALVFRRLGLALVLLLPLLVPLAVVAVACRALGVPLSVGTVMVFSVSLGIAVDDAIHVLHAARRGLSLSRLLEEVGEAVASTSLVIAAGFLTLALSGFLPTRQFGWTTALAMGVALWSNVVVLPGLLIRLAPGRRGGWGALDLRPVPARKVAS